jgi:K+-sensing histidine kinase KdpD
MIRYLTRDRPHALLAPIAVAAILLPLRSSWSNTNDALVLVVVVVAVAAIGNRTADALAAVSAAVWFDLFFAVPYEQFTIRSSADVTTAVLLLLVGLAVSQLAARARRGPQVMAITDTRYLTQIYEAAQLTQSARSPHAVVDYVRDQLTDPLDLTGCRFEYRSLLGHPPRPGALSPPASLHSRPLARISTQPVKATLSQGFATSSR